MSDFVQWESEMPDRFGRGVLVTGPMPRVARETVAPSPYRVAHRGAGSRAERSGRVREWAWAVFGGAAAASPFVAMVWMVTGR